GATLAIRNVNGSQFVFVAGVQGVKAGRVDLDRRWHEAEAPDAQYAAVFSGEGAVFLTSREQRQVLVTTGAENQWSAFPLPSRTAEVTSIALDPFEANRMYFGTAHEGLFVWDGAALSPYEPKTVTAAAAGAGVGAWK
ncbi:MAG TPA: hypothetical protein VKD22_17945, partial [Ramlibacter sp.]|nr:hypothetical protein [Ramlibacter sp.]